MDRIKPTVESHLRVYSSLDRSCVPFEPLQQGEVKIYACGITVYDEAHVGHARQAIVFDMFRRYFEFRGYHVTYIRNFTDVDDKIINKSIQTGRPALEISAHFIESTRHDLASLKVRPASVEPKVSDHISDIINFIQGLIEKGYGYMSGGDVLFDVSHKSDYGKLSRRRLSECLNADQSEHKRNPQDFALWKAAKPGEPAWDSPWGAGRPGWHIECSAMAQRYLGERFDIHGGGIDLLFPHHENEIAQSEAYSGEAPAKYWIHNGLVNVDGQKMSKSLGNMFNIKDALKEHHPDVIRFAVLAQRYNAPIDFSGGLFKGATKRVMSCYRTLARMDELLSGRSIPASEKGSALGQAILNDFVAAMDDDFNSAKAVADLFLNLSKVNEILDSKQPADAKAAEIAPARDALRQVAQVLGMFDENPEECLSSMRQSVLRESGISSSEIEQLIERRRTLKAAKDYAAADQVRKALMEKGIGLQDLPGGRTVWDVVL